MALKYRLETEDSESHYVVCDDTETGETVVMSTHTSKRWGNMLVQLLTDAYESGRAENASLKEQIKTISEQYVLATDDLVDRNLEREKVYTAVINSFRQQLADANKRIAELEAFTEQLADPPVVKMPGKRIGKIIGKFVREGD